MLAAGCGGGDKKPAEQKEARLKLGVTEIYGEIMEFLLPTLKNDGLNVELVNFSDYVKPDISLNDKEIDANFFQHGLYLEDFARNRKMELVAICPLFIAPIAAYSKKITDVKDLPDGASIAIQNDSINGGRALALRESAKLLKLKEGKDFNATVSDIVENPKKLKIIEIEAAFLPMALDDTGLSVSSCNFAMETKLNPVKDSLLIEPKESPYASIIAVRKGDEKRLEIIKLCKYLQSPEVKKFIEDKYNCGLIPAF